jgi:hypothetical protein
MRIESILVLIAAASVLSGARAQTSLISPSGGTKTLAATLKVYAFPGAGQAAEGQQQAAQQQLQAQQSTSGSAVRGAVSGAAGGDTR